MNTTILARLGAAVMLVCGTASAAQQPPSTEDVMREDASGLTPYSPAGATVMRDTHGSPCVASEPFELLACGPLTRIRLALMPGIYGTLDSTTTQGGRMAQIMDQLLAFGQVTESGTMSELARQEDAVDGSSITIAIPLIDYGFQGSFGNAAITMNRANQEEHYSIYQAIGPRDSVPGPGHAFPLTGQVTIEEYTPWVLRGTFSAAMVDLAQSDLTKDDPVLNVIHDLSGRFNIIGPWRGDDRAGVIEPQDLNRTIGEDIANLFAVAGGDPVPGTRGGASAPGPANAGSASSGGASCDCSCNTAESAPAVCQSRCAGTFQACQGEPAAMISDAEMAESASLDDRVAAYTAELRTRFADFLEQRYGGNPQFDTVLSGYLEAFDDASNLETVVIIVANAGMPIDCPPPEGVAERMKMAALFYCNSPPSRR